jgi:hypothetical protein
MRSEHVFRADEHVGNRFLLCRTVASLTRSLHLTSSNIQDTIIDAFVYVAIEPSLMDLSVAGPRTDEDVQAVAMPHDVKAKTPSTPSSS